MYNHELLWQQLKKPWLRAWSDYDMPLGYPCGKSRSRLALIARFSPDWRAARSASRVPALSQNSLPRLALPLASYSRSLATRPQKLTSCRIFARICEVNTGTYPRRLKMTWQRSWNGSNLKKTRNVQGDKGPNNYELKRKEVA